MNLSKNAETLVLNAGRGKIRTRGLRAQILLGALLIHDEPLPIQ